MSANNSIILIRYSALGDVIICVPLLYHLAQTYPQYNFYFVTKQIYVSAFSILPDNVRIIGMQMQVDSIWSFAKKLVKITGTKARIIDMHNVLRSRILSVFLYYLGGVKTMARLQKVRRLRRAFLRSGGREPQQLPSVWELYFEVFLKAGLPLPKIGPDFLKYKNIFIQKYGGWQALPGFWQDYASKPFFIIAPFASRTTKIYPKDLMREVISRCIQAKISVLLIGNGRNEEQQIRAYIIDFASKYLQSILEQPLSFAQELFLFSHAKGALVMDSANLHLCGLADIPTISIWGATSPRSGFDIWPKNHAIHSHLDCWPCAIYGEKPCVRSQDQFACLKSISPILVWNAIKNILL